MLLVDRDIQAFLQNGNIDTNDQTSICHGDEGCITNIGYDLRAKFFIKSGKKAESCELAPGESAFVSSQEYIKFDDITSGILNLKNSRIRMGLTMDAPVYQPGHETYIFFRITNISSNSIDLKIGEKYAMLMFYQFEKGPIHTYSGTFQNENNYSGLARYDSQYADQIKSLDGKVKDIKSLEKSIYSNVITILTIFIAIFTILNVNISLSNNIATAKDFLVYNIANVGAISFLATLMDEMIHKDKKSHKLWFVPVICFLILVLIVLFA